jgi:hypothetical protein
MTLDMGGAAGAVMIAAMLVMMLVMGGFSLRFLARAVAGGIQHAIRRPAGLLAGGKEGTP